MVIENILKNEILDVNRGIIKGRRNLAQLLEEPFLVSEGRRVEVDTGLLKKVAEETTFPLSQILFPVNFFIPAGSYEGYVQDESSVEVLRILGIHTAERGGRYWVQKYVIRRLTRDYPGLFQSIILP